MNFSPDLIIEATAVCNRSCHGCYAPNVVSIESATDLFNKKKDLFLDPNDLDKILRENPSRAKVISIRGGEPSLHPRLAEILRVATIHSEKVIIETHGRWLLPETMEEYSKLIREIQSLGSTVKISFDKMHGLSKDELHQITQLLDWNFIPFLIAITENNEQEFEVARKQCSWIPSEEIIFQKKAFSQNGLIQPRMGVVSVEGKLNNGLSIKDSLLEKVAVTA